MSSFLEIWIIFELLVNVIRTFTGRGSRELARR